MTRFRQRARRSLRRGIAPWLVVGAGALAACNGNTSNDAGDSASDGAHQGDVADVGVDGASDVPSDQPGADGGVTCTDMRGPANVTVFAACGAVCSAPTDAVLNAAGTTAYFTAFAADGSGAVFSATSGATPTMVVGGFQSPVGIAISPDDQTLYVLDLVNDTATVHGPSTIYSVAIASGMRSAAALTGTNVVTASAIAVSADGHSLYIASSASDTTNGIYTVGTAGGAATSVATAMPFVDPAGITVAPDGTLYVNDPLAAVGGFGNIIRVAGSTATARAANFVTRFPAGVALGCDNASVLVSGQTPGSSARLSWVGADGTTVTPIASTMLVTPTGLHRALGANVYVVADDSAGSDQNGAIFTVTP